MAAFASYWKEMLGTFGAIATVILGFLWVEDRYNPRTAIEEAKTEVMVQVQASHVEIIKQIKIGDYTDQIAVRTLLVAQLTGTISRYDLMEEDEELSVKDGFRRQALRDQKNEYIKEIERLSDLREQLQ